MSDTGSDREVAIAAESSLDHVRARLRGHGGDAHVTDVTDGQVTVEWYGACQGCPAVGLTFGGVVAPALRQVPGVRAVRSPRVMMSDAALRRIEAMTAGAEHRGEEAA
jgi:Fe-S cluster biogenesis protein NfuA